MIQVGDAVCQLKRVVVRQAGHPGAEFDLRGLAERPSDEKIRCGHALPDTGIVLANPGHAALDPRESSGPGFGQALPRLRACSRVTLEEQLLEITHRSRGPIASSA